MDVAPPGTPTHDYAAPHFKSVGMLNDCSGLHCQDPANALDARQRPRARIEREICSRNANDRYHAVPGEKRLYALEG